MKVLTKDGLLYFWNKIKNFLDGKLDTISDLNTIRDGAALGATALLSYTETDPIYSASVAAGITSSDISNWNSKTSNIGTITGITMNGTSKGTSGVVNLGTVVTSETDPVFTASAAHGITSSDITNWNNKLDSYTETDPTVPSWAKLSTKPSYDYSEINNTPTLATVATSGSYNDLSNKPTIPTVNNATLTIQKNGTNVATFTANASTGATANITVPVATSDLTNDSGFLGDTDVSYDANTKTLIIGSFNEYTITLTGNGVSNMYNITVNGESKTTSDFPLEVDEGSSLGFKHLYDNISCTVTMGGTDITNNVRTLQNEGSGMISYSYYVYDITNITGDVVVTINVNSGGGAND